MRTSIRSASLFGAGVKVAGWFAFFCGSFGFSAHPSDLVVSGQTERVERAGHLFLQEQDAAGANVDAAS